MEAQFAERKLWAFRKSHRELAGRWVGLDCRGELEQYAFAVLGVWACSEFHIQSVEVAVDSVLFGAGRLAGSAAPRGGDVYAACDRAREQRCGCFGGPDDRRVRAVARSEHRFFRAEALLGYCFTKSEFTRLERCAAGIQAGRNIDPVRTSRVASLQA